MKGNSAISEEFESDECLYRAVPTDIPWLWDDEGFITSSVFINRRGCSVDRGWRRTKEEAVGFLLEKMKGSNPSKDYAVVYIVKKDCDLVKVACKYMPTPSDKFHSEIHGDENGKICLSDHQAATLAEMAKTEKSI